MKTINQANIDPAAIAHVINNPPPQPHDRIRRISNVPIAALVHALTDPKQHCGGRNRRVLKAALEYIVLRPQTPAIDPAVKLAVKLEKLTLAKLLRRRSQAARRAATAKYILESLSPNSKFRDGVAAEQTHQLGVWKQVCAEITVRTTHNK
jgi:hypothetical protein